MREHIQKQLPYLSAGNKKGSVLVLVLWALALLTVFAAILGYGVRQKLSITSRLDDRSALRFIGEAGVKRALSRIKKMSEGKTSYSLNNGGSDSALFMSGRVGSGSFSVYHDYRETSDVDKRRIYGFTDEESRLNINTASRDIMKNLFFELGVYEVAAQNLAASIEDWRDEDNLVSVPFGSAEDFYYRSLSLSYEAKDADFGAVEELLLVKDVDVNTFDKIKDYVTIYGDGRVNVNTASGEVLRALGLGRELTGKILDFRRGEDGVMGTSDDNVFSQTATVPVLLANYSGLSESELVRLKGVMENSLKVDSFFFRIKSSGNLPGKKVSMDVSCVTDTGGNILYWHEFYRSDENGDK